MAGAEAGGSGRREQGYSSSRSRLVRAAHQRICAADAKADLLMFSKVVEDPRSSASLLKNRATVRRSSVREAARELGVVALEPTDIRLETESAHDALVLRHRLRGCQSAEIGPEPACVRAERVGLRRIRRRDAGVIDAGAEGPQRLRHLPIQRGDAGDVRAGLGLRLEPDEYLVELAVVGGDGSHGGRACSWAGRCRDADNDPGDVSGHAENQADSDQDLRALRKQQPPRSRQPGSVGGRQLCLARWLFAVAGEPNPGLWCY